MTRVINHWVHKNADLLFHSTDAKVDQSNFHQYYMTMQQLDTIELFKQNIHL